MGKKASQTDLTEQQYGPTTLPNWVGSVPFINALPSPITLNLKPTSLAGCSRYQSRRMRWGWKRGRWRSTPWHR